MRKLLAVAAVLLVTVSIIFTFAESRGSAQALVTLQEDDHDYNAPVQVGYAVITSSSTSNDLVAFGTFGLREGLGTTQAGVLPQSLTTNAILFFETSGRLSKNLGVAIVNPDSISADVTLTVRNSDGTELASTMLMVAPGEQVSKFVTELFADNPSVPKEMTGTLVITSTNPVSVIGLRFRGLNFSTLPVTNLSTPSPVPVIDTGIGGPGAILLPQFATGGGWATEIVIANTGATSLTVRVDLFKKDGTPLTASLNGTSASSFTDIEIPAGGVFVLAPRDWDGDDDF
jgi:hypothetical protein